MSELQKRIDIYINSQHADPLAVGLLCEQRAHLKVANRSCENTQIWGTGLLSKIFELENRIRGLEEKCQN